MYPAISVYMTVKNGARWVRSAVRSIQEQTFRDWELVIVNDGSTDETSFILDDIASRDERIRLVHTEGIGRGAALNLALSLCRAEFVANLDADDVSHPRRLEIQYRMASLHPHIALFCSKFLVIYDNETIVWPAFSDWNPTVQDVTNALPYFNPVSHSSILAQKRALLAVGGYGGTHSCHADYELWVRLAEAGYRLARINLSLVAKRIHSAQSFEARDHVRYVWRSLRIQARAINALRAGAGGWIVLGGRLVWSFVPRRFRVMVRRMRQE